jgi:hypothetical protein
MMEAVYTSETSANLEPEISNYVKVNKMVPVLGTMLWMRIGGIKAKLHAHLTSGFRWTLSEELHIRL